MKKFNGLSESEKTQFTRIAVGFAGIALNDATAELIWRVFKRMQEKKGEFSVKDGVELEFLVRKKYNTEAKNKKTVTAEKEVEP